MRHSPTNVNQPFEGLWNFRDLCGPREPAAGSLKSGVLFRSDELANLTPADVEKLRALKLKTICDLRTPDESRFKPDRLPPGHAIRLVAVPVYHQVPGFLRTDFLQCLGEPDREKAFTDSLRQFYVRMALECTPETGRILELVAHEENLPLLIHCTGGKDRTGFVSAIIQLLAGMPRESVMADFLASNQVVAPRMQAAMAGFPEISTERLLPMVDVFPEYLDAAIDAIFGRYGSWEDYALACGQLPQSLRKFRERLQA